MPTFRSRFRPLLEKGLSGLTWVLSERRVITGPFRRMVYVQDSQGSQFWPKILGTYEKDLHGLLEQILAAPDTYDVVVNVGAGEGYYAVGISRCLPKVPVWAFEMESKGRELIAALARKNGCEDRIRIEGTCSVEDLQKVLSQYRHPLVVMDVEGAEKWLLDPVKVPDFERCSILLEVHDFIDRKLGPDIWNKFERTHRRRELWENERTLSDHPIGLLRFLGRLRFRQHVLQFMDERRPEKMRWFWLEPKAAGQSLKRSAG